VDNIKRTFKFLSILLGSNGKTWAILQKTQT